MVRVYVHFWPGLFLRFSRCCLERAVRRGEASSRQVMCNYTSPVVGTGGGPPPSFLLSRHLTDARLSPTCKGERKLLLLLPLRSSSPLCHRKQNGPACWLAWPEWGEGDAAAHWTLT